MSPDRLTSPNIAPVQAKYQDRSLIARYANWRFIETIRHMIAAISFHSILDAGCGEGEVLARALSGYTGTITAFDLDIHRLTLARQRVADVGFLMSNIHRLPFTDNSFDLIISLEVLEHISDPQKALRELWRVSRRYVLLSVPNEPWWRIGNMMRLKYLRAWGNTPEHINHWTYPGFVRLIRQHFAVNRIATPVLWTFVLGEKMLSKVNSRF